MKVSKSTRIIILSVPFLSAWYLISASVLPYLEKRIDFVNQILQNKMEPPYQYRIFEPLILKFFSLLISLFIHSDKYVHLISSSIIIFLIFLGIYAIFYFYLSKFVSTPFRLLGLLILAVIIPLSVTGSYVGGDFIMLLFYLISFA